MKRVRVSDRDYRYLGPGRDVIILWGASRNGTPTSQRVEGDFYPDRAPVISATLRSDDLAKVVYSILRAKGIKPRSGRASVMYKQTWLPPKVKGRP